ncbi:hypothetical protein DOTSEDRAFT_86453 [Dothistroma septosporum NZE10]|uniref:Uncharacterized protein n=1 Tax=Dothistroma septosporum (strain NZE10 / CBS 128990) TaxID=675120 RepID=N1Q105_DOTSN|nr:hypothetical protein DOTSEDRAFT_86453 [Dothistroma septosporum NZE10]
MPRIHPKDFLRARAINKAVHSLLPVCRDLTSARHEFRWLQEHAAHLSQRLGGLNQQGLLAGFVSRRARGEPLQYILSSGYFGDLEITCRPGVLIPRQETAASVSHLAKRLLFKENEQEQGSKPVRVLDVCTGTGCIPLLFHHEFYQNKSHRYVTLELVGIDISPKALSLARENLLHQIAGRSHCGQRSPIRTRSLHSIAFVQADILKDENWSDDPPSLSEALSRLGNDQDSGVTLPTFDILISNPPYISPKSFITTTRRSVRDYEPKTALVPARSESTSQSDVAIGDTFYSQLLQIADLVKAKILLLEVSDMDQATRVASMAIAAGAWESIEIWRDDPDHNGSVAESIDVGGTKIKVRGSGHGRSVFAYRAEANEWLKM